MSTMQHRKKEDSKHVLSLCPQYQQGHAQKVRDKEIPEVLNIRNIEEAMKMFYFVQSVIKIRKLALIEM